MLLVVIGSLFLLLVPAGLAVHRSARRDVRAVRKAAVLTTQDMRQPGPTMVAFTGQAVESTTVKSYLGQTPCVWFQYQCIEHYEVLRSSAIGARWYPKTQVVVEYSAPPSITLRDEHGQVACDLHVTDTDQPTGLTEVFRSKENPASFGIQVPAANREGKSSRTTGYELREWVIRPGQQLHVVGEVTRGATSEPTIIRPRDGGRFLISGKSGDQVAEQARRSSRTNLGCLLIVGSLGLTLIILGLAAS